MASTVQEWEHVIPVAADMCIRSSWWAMKDRFGSVDFEEIENKYF
jgi:hypothetical protein